MVVLVLITLFLFREGFGFFGGNLQNLRVYRSGGLEYVDIIRDQADANSALSRALSDVRVKELSEIATRPEQRIRAASESSWFHWVSFFPLSERLNVFTAGALLALMAVPTIFTLSEDALRNVPPGFGAACAGVIATLAIAKARGRAAFSNRKKEGMPEKTPAHSGCLGLRDGCYEIFTPPKPRCYKPAKKARSVP